MQEIKNYKGLTIAVAVLFALQTTLPVSGLDAMPGMTDAIFATISAIIMFGSQVLTAIQQYIAEGVKNKALIPTVILLVISILGWVNDLLDVVHIGNSLGLWIRWFITIINLILTAYSTAMFPTVAQKALNIQKRTQL